MEQSNFMLETEAYESLRELMKEAKRTKELFDRASLSVPAPLARMLGESGDRDSRSAKKVIIPAMEGPTRPRQAGEDWVWIPLEKGKTVTTVLACMREFGEAIKPKDLVNRVIALRPNVGSGGVYNTGPRLEKARKLMRKDGLWALVDPESGPIIQGKFIWGSTKDLQKQEVALHRRMIILHLLRVYNGGLQEAQIVERLNEFPQCKAPVSKDLVKADMTALADEKKAKRTSSRKWVLTKDE